MKLRPRRVHVLCLALPALLIPWPLAAGNGAQTVAYCNRQDASDREEGAPVALDKISVTLITGKGRRITIYLADFEPCPLSSSSAMSPPPPAAEAPAGEAPPPKNAADTRREPEKQSGRLSETPIVPPQDTGVFIMTPREDFEELVFAGSGTVAPPMQALVEGYAKDHGLGVKIDARDSAKT